MFFENFPVSKYTTLDGESILVTDIIRAIKIPKNVLDDANLYTFYQVKDDETPEIISHKFYKSTTYHWVIMAINQRYDIWEDYPKSDSVIRRYCQTKYGDINGTHHYVDSVGNIVDEYTFPKTPVTFLEYETEENEKKRVIKILDPIYLSEFVSLYTQLISED